MVFVSSVSTRRLAVMAGLESERFRPAPRTTDPAIGRLEAANRLPRRSLAGVMIQAGIALVLPPFRDDAFEFEPAAGRTATSIGIAEVTD
jgi:hypothetical protein